MISAVNGRKRALLTKSALEWHNKRCTAQSTLCVGNKKGKTELKAMCDFKKKKKKKKKKSFFSIAILGSRYDTRIVGPSIAMHRCIDASLRPYWKTNFCKSALCSPACPASVVRAARWTSSYCSQSALGHAHLLVVHTCQECPCLQKPQQVNNQSVWC